MVDEVQLFWRVYTLIKHNENLVRAMICRAVASAVAKCTQPADQRNSS